MTHLKSRAIVRLFGLLALGSAVGCQAIIGVESRDTDPLIGGCTLPTQGEAKVRFGNLVPSDAVVDICIRKSGGDYGRPVLRGGGSECVSGFKYAELSAPFAAPSGKIDVKVVAAGSTCKAAALSEAKGIDAPSGSTTTLLRMGNAKVPESVKAFRESPGRAKSGNAKLRLIHASPGTGALDWGLADSPRLPVDISQPFLASPMAYGESTTKDSKTVKLPSTPDENGYLEFLGTKINLAAAPTGQKRALLATEFPGTEGGRTIIAIGDPAQPFFPVRALVCSDLDLVGLKTSCTVTQLGTLSIDVFNAYLYGQYAADEALRRPLVRDAIVSRTDGEVMCITAVSRRPDQDEIVKAAKDKGTWPYSYQSDTSLDTQATEPTDPTGKIPAPYTTPPCGGTNLPDQVEAALGCIQSKCTGADGKYNGVSTACFGSNCSSQLIPFIGGNKDEQRCFNCMTVATLADLTTTEVRDRCTKDVRDYKAFDGVTDSFILSKFPLTDTKTYVLPSTSYQRVVQYAKVEIEKDKFIDFYCGELSAAFGDLVPYYGHYAVAGGGDPWEQEQVWQANLVTKFVKATSGARPAIITGEWAAARAYKSADGKHDLEPQSPQVLDALEKVLIPALPKDFVPFCTECAAPENPYNGDKSIWQYRTYVFNMPTTSGVEASAFFTEMPLTVGGEKRPISKRWGFNTRVLRP